MAGTVLPVHDDQRSLRLRATDGRGDTKQSDIPIAMSAGQRAVRLAADPQNDLARKRNALNQTVLPPEGVQSSNHGAGVAAAVGHLHLEAVDFLDHPDGMMTVLFSK